MDISTIINIVLCILSFILAALSLIFVVITIKQNNKMIESSTRPNIQIYSVYVDGITYLIIKNFGQSEAIIDNINCDYVFSKEELMAENLVPDIFSYLVGSPFAPGYSVRCPLVGFKTPDQMITFDISYHSSCKTYQNKFSFNPCNGSGTYGDPFPTDPHDTSTSLHLITRELRSILKNQL